MNIYSRNYEVELTDIDRNAIQNAFFIITLISDTMAEDNCIIQDMTTGEFFTMDDALICKGVLSCLNNRDAKLEILKCGGF